MGKKAKKPPYTKQRSRADKERLMENEEVYTEAELAAKKVQVRKAILAAEAQLKREEKQIKSYGFCPKCRLMQTPNQKCANPHCELFQYE